MAEPTAEPRTTARAARSAAPDDRAASLAHLGPERWLAVPPLVVLLVAIALVAAGQLAEDISDSQPLQLLDPALALQRWTLIVAVLYMLAISITIDRLVVRSIPAIDRVVRVNQARFEAYIAQMRRHGLATDLVLLAASALIVAVVFLPLGTSLPIDDPVTRLPVFLPANGLAAAAVLIQYTLVGWAVLTLVWCTVRRARALGELSREPLQVDVFDTTNVLPLGNIALATALAPAGVVVILLFGFGRPSSPLSWTLLVLVTLASLFALLLPLRGTHGQMERAKGKALEDINARLRASYDELRQMGEQTRDQAALLNDRVGTLVNLRKTVSEMTTWPFRDSLAFGRAVLIALAPLVYTVVNELIKIALGR